MQEELQKKQKELKKSAEQTKKTYEELSFVHGVKGSFVKDTRFVSCIEDVEKLGEFVKRGLEELGFELAL